MKDYIERAIRTDRTDEAYETLIKNRLQNSSVIRLLHAAIGLCTETGELQDMLKRHIFYGADIDLINIKEEIGDILWYVALALDELDTTFEKVMKANIEKLKQRYPDKFTKENALNRNLKQERNAIEEI